MSEPSPIASFQVRPGRLNQKAGERRMYWIVSVFRTAGDMRRFFRTINVHKDKGERFAAVVMPQLHQKLDGGRWVQTPFLGHVLFCKSKACAETVAHESVHMATSYIRAIKHGISIGRREIDEREEALAYAVGSCARQLVNAFWKHGVFRKKR